MGDTNTNGRIAITLCVLEILVYLHHLVYLMAHEPYVPLVAHIQLNAVVANVSDHDH